MGLCAGSCDFGLGYPNLAKVRQSSRGMAYFDCGAVPKVPLKFHLKRGIQP
jgi:hypothetical protein